MPDHIPDDRSPAPAPVTMPDTMELRLRKPIAWKTLEYSKLDLREPTAAELIGCDKLEGMEADIHLLSAVAGVPEPVAGMIGARDFVAATRFLGQFTALPTPAEGDVSDAKTVQLRHPIEWDGQTYNVLELREPTAAETAAWDRENGVAADCRIIASVTGLPELAMRRLRARDLIEAGSYLAHFLVPAPTDGAGFSTL